MRRAADNQKTAREGRAAVAAEMIRGGAIKLEVVTAHGAKVLRVTNAAGHQVHLHVKSRRSGTWQGSTTAGNANPVRLDPPTFWVFVDLASEPVRFFVVPDRWMRRNIHEVHEAYLQRHGGKRLMSPDSRHHAIEPHRIERWRSRWDLLRISGARA